MAEAGDDTVAARVEVSEMMGSELYIHATLEGNSEAAGKEMVIRIPTTDLPSQYQGGIPYGTVIHFGFPVGLLHLFNRDTELSLL